MAIRYLRASTFLYLGFPLYLFYLSWLQPAVGIGASIGLTLLLGWILTEKAAAPSPLPLPRGAIAVLGIVATVLTVLSGTGQVAHQAYDYWIHNAKIADLTQHSWPLHIQQTGQSICYYMGYFLPIAFFAKLTGLPNTISLIWTSLGLWMALLWMYLVGGRSLLGTCLLTGFCTPLNAFNAAVSVVSKVSEHLPLGKVDAINMQLTSLAPYMSFIEQLDWVPNQLLPAGLGVGILLTDSYLWPRKRGVWLSLGVLLYWAPFVCVGLALLTLAFWLFQAAFWHWLKTPEPWFYALLLGLTFAPLLAYLGASNGLQVAQFLWQVDPLWLLRYVLCLGVDLLLLVWLLWHNPVQLSWKPVLVYGLVFLGIAPLVHVGHYNDFYLRATLPALLLLGLYTAQTVELAWQTRRRNRWQWAVLLLFGCCLIQPATYISRAMLHNRFTGSKPLVSSTTSDLYQTLLITFGPIDAYQYTCKDDSFYRNYLEKR